MKNPDVDVDPDPDDDPDEAPDDDEVEDIEEELENAEENHDEDEDDEDDEVEPVALVQVVWLFLKINKYCVSIHLNYLKPFCYVELNLVLFWYKRTIII